MSISKRQIFQEVYNEQEEVLSIIDRRIRVKDLNISSIGKWAKFNFNIVASNERKSFKCLCPICYSWVGLWDNWFAYKEDIEMELLAKCSCGCIIPQGDLLCEEIK